MNKIFKVIWSKSKQCYVVVSEMAKNTTGKKKIVVASILATLAMTTAVQDVNAVNGSGNRAGFSDGSSGVAFHSTQGLAIGLKNGDVTSANGNVATVAVGAHSNAKGSSSVAIGGGSADGQGAVALGWVSATGNSAVALGGTGGTAANGDNAFATSGGVATGANTFAASGGVANKNNAIAIGSDTQSTGESAVALGKNTQAKSSNSIAVGTNATSSDSAAVAIGYDSKAGNTGTVAIGYGANVTGYTSVAIGNSATATGGTSVVIGDGASSTVGLGTALGRGAKANHEGSVALGAQSETSAANSTSTMTVAGKSYTLAGGTANGTVSIGSASKKRTITNVAAGRVSATSTDAVNGSQLHAIKEVVDNHENRITTIEGDINTLNNRIVNGGANSLHEAKAYTDQQVSSVAAASAALAGLHPLDFDKHDKWSYSVGFGNYKNANAAALGAFYRPNKNTMFNAATTVGNGRNTISLGANFKFGKSSEEVTTEDAAQLKKDMKDLSEKYNELAQKYNELAAKLESK